MKKGQTSSALHTSVFLGTIVVYIESALCFTTNSGGFGCKSLNSIYFVVHGTGC